MFDSRYVKIGLAYQATVEQAWGSGLYNASGERRVAGVGLPRVIIHSGDALPANGHQRTLRN